MVHVQVALILAAFASWAHASTPVFLAPDWEDSSGGVEHRAFLDELEQIVGPGHRKVAEFNLQGISAILRATFVALPKTGRGGLSASAARYTIHRYFIMRHGWQVKGLAPVGGSWLPSKPVLGMGSHLPPRLRDLFVERFDGDNFELSDIALITATVEALIHAEAVRRLHSTYQVLGTDTQANLTKQEAVDTLYSCMTTGYNTSQISASQLESTRRAVTEAQASAAPGLTIFQFSDVARVLEVAIQNIGHLVDEAYCQDMADKLIDMQETTGRVKLVDFYGSFLDKGVSYFQERPEYLRQSGALDESDPSVPRVIIPNYLDTPLNCLNVSSYYDLCCIDLCEDLFEELEMHLKAPQGTPAEIIKVLTGVRSAYVVEGRAWPDSLTKKLREVAEHHGGTVPLHGRLFAQWMHFAYPLECPYPHLSGATKLQTKGEWSDETGMPSSATQAEMRSIIGALKHPFGPASCSESEESMCMWHPEEELVDAVNWKAPLLT